MDLDKPTPLHTCVSPKGHFVFGIHKPSYSVANQRVQDRREDLGREEGGGRISNRRNFPPGEVAVAEADWIFEIPNPFPFRGATFIKKKWADRRAAEPTAIKLPARPDYSLANSLTKIIGRNDQVAIAQAFRELPQPVLLATATTSTDPDDLVHLARISCEFVTDEEGGPTGMVFRPAADHQPRPVIHDHPLFEAVVNNPALPDRYKTVMVLRPGAQGGSEIIGEYRRADDSAHVFEYLRGNSYIAGGHYAANMADDAIRYSVRDLTEEDMHGLRHLYYQRTFLRIAELLGLAPPTPRKCLTGSELEQLRHKIVAGLAEDPSRSLPYNATLWGWNYGFDFAPTRYRLHASHQQIHQQFAMLPDHLEDNSGNRRTAYSCGDLVADSSSRFRRETGCDFFDSYLAAIRSNTRTDGQATGPASLIIHQDENVILFVPKAQTSQWEIQLLCLDKVGNIVEADQATRKSIDLAILLAVKIIDGLGGRMVTTIEFAKRLDSPDQDQRLLYSFLPKLPDSPGAFSEAQLRWINGHYPEDFAESCRRAKEIICR